MQPTATGGMEIQRLCYSRALEILWNPKERNFRGIRTATGGLAEKYLKRVEQECEKTNVWDSNHLLAAIYTIYYLAIACIHAACRFKCHTCRLKY